MDDCVIGLHFRGFEHIEVPLGGLSFLVGDNSSGKSSILYLLDAVLHNDLNDVPSLNEELGVAQYDYFSPFFDNHPVSFGFVVARENGVTAKFITVEKGRGIKPFVSSCTYIFGRKEVSLRLQKGFVYKRIRDVVYESTSDLTSIHLDGGGFTKVRQKVNEIPLSDLPALFVYVQPNDVGDPKGFLDVLDIKAPKSFTLGPIRALPQKYYDLSGKQSTLGNHFASVWVGLSRSAKQKAIKSLEDFGAESGLFETVSVKKVSTEIDPTPLIIVVERKGRKFLLNQVGVGVSQVIPVLLDTLLSLPPKPRIALIQQPELHLHPVAQAALGTFFFDLVKQGLLGVLETHSSYLIDRFCSDLKRGSDGKDCNARVGFASSGAKGNKVTWCRIGSNGLIDGAPEDYYRFFLSESVRTMI